MGCRWERKSLVIEGDDLRRLMSDDRLGTSLREALDEMLQPAKAWPPIARVYAGARRASAAAGGLRAVVASPA